MNRAGRFAGVTIVLTAIAMLAVLAAGCGGSSTTSEAQGQSSTTAGSTAMETKQYTNSDYKFSFSYPATWEMKSDVTTDASSGGGSVFSTGAFDPKGTVLNDILRDGAVVSIYKLNITVDDSMMGELRPEVETVVAEMGKQQEGLKTLEALQETTLGGIPGFKVTYSFPADGVQLVSTLYFLFQRDLEYQVTLQSAETLWDKLGPEFDTVLKSFKVDR
jgi:hypothetical protein